MREYIKKVWGCLIRASKSQVGSIEAPKGEEPQGAEFETPKVSNGRGLGRVLLRRNRGSGERCDLSPSPSENYMSSRKSCIRSQMTVRWSIYRGLHYSNKKSELMLMRRATASV